MTAQDYVFKGLYGFYRCWLLAVCHYSDKFSDFKQVNVSWEGYLLHKHIFPTFLKTISMKTLLYVRTLHFYKLMQLRIKIKMLLLTNC